MATRTPRTRNQRGITLVEILLVATIVAASVVSVFVFAQKSSATAAVKREQGQVETIARTVESIFKFQPNFSELGTDGASHLYSKTGTSGGLTFELDERGNRVLTSSFGGNISLRSARVDFPNGTPGRPNNGFVLTYSDLSSSQCSGLITSTAPLATRIDVAPASAAGAMGPASATGLSSSAVLVASNGSIETDRSALSSACKTSGDAHPTVYLSFAPSRAIADSPPPAPAPTSTCAPVRETQLTGCPPGQSGSILEERHRTCTGGILSDPSWVEIERTCVAEGTTPPDLTTTPPTSSCETTTFTETTACPGSQLGQITRSRDFNSCTGAYTSWEEVNNSCHTPAADTCVPEEQERRVDCPAGMEPASASEGDRTLQVRSSSCDSAGQTVWSAWREVSNTCRARTPGARRCITVPVHGTRWVDDSASCASGYLGSITWQYQQQRHGQGYDDCFGGPAAPDWGPWTDTGSTRGHNDTCEIICVVLPDSTASRTASCPTGYSGQIVEEQTTSWSCPAVTGSPVSSQSAWVEVGNTCAANCVAPSPTTETRDVSCPSGQSGTITQEQTTSWSCPTTTGSPVSSLSAWVEINNTCAANCVAPSPTTAPITRTRPNETRDACPAGNVGSTPQRRTVTENGTRTTSWTCPTITGSPVSSTSDSWLGTYTYGNWVANGTDTCSAACVVPSPSTRTQPGPLATQNISVTRSTTQTQAGPNQTEPLACVAGQYGNRTRTRTTTQTRSANQTGTQAQTRTTTQTQTASCPSPTGSPVWSAWSTPGAPFGTWTNSGSPSGWGAPHAPFGTWTTTSTGSWTTSGSCTNCGTPTPQTRRVWQDRSQPCPTGHTGSHTWQEERNQSRTGTYNCPAGTTSLPSPTWSPTWTNGSWTGNTRSRNNTCEPQTCRWRQVSAYYAPNWGSLDGEYISYSGPGVSCTASWGNVRRGPGGGQSTVAACFNLLPTNPAPGSWYEYVESSMGGSVENGFEYTADCT